LLERAARAISPGLSSVEKYIVETGIPLVKYWLEVGNEEQKQRFEARIEDPLRQWKLRARKKISITS
jgi:polyphosphate kinase 2 (PPK2 family)